MDELRQQLQDKMNKLNINNYQLSKLLKISFNTINRFMNGENKIRPSTKEKLNLWVSISEISDNKVLDSKLISTMRVPVEVYNYLKTSADEQNVSITDVTRNLLIKCVKEDYSSKSILESTSIMERSLSSIIDKRILPFIKQQDKMMMELYSEILWLDRALFRGTNTEIDDPEVKEEWEANKEKFIQDIKDDYFHHHNN